MAHRAHTLDELRNLPEVASKLARSAMQLLFTALALAWLDPPSAFIALLAASLALAIPFCTQPMLAERELRQRSHAAALTRYYLDSLLGLVAARTHGAERALRHRHESLLVEWGRSSLHLLRGGVVIEGVQMLIGSLLAAWLVLGFVARNARPGSMLLFVYWTLSLRSWRASWRRHPAVPRLPQHPGARAGAVETPDESTSAARLPPITRTTPVGPPWPSVLSRCTCAYAAASCWTTSTVVFGPASMSPLSAVPAQGNRRSRASCSDGGRHLPAASRSTMRR